MKQILKESVSKCWNDFSNGNLNVKARYVGRLVGEILLCVIGGASASLGLKAIKASSKSGKLAELLSSIGKGTTKADDAVRALKAVTEAIANAKYTRNLLQSTRGFMDDMAVLLDNAGLSTSRFNQLRSVSADTLSGADRIVMKAIRDAIPMPTNGTVMQKVIPQGDIVKYLDGTYNKVGGYVTKAQDVKQLTSYDDIYNSLRLDYSGTTFKPATDECVGVIRFKTPEISKAEIPYSQAMGGDTVAGQPFTGNGFTAATNGQAIPEYKCSDLMRLYDGAELYTVTKNGTETLAAVYDSTLGKFVDILK